MHAEITKVTEKINILFSHHIKINNSVLSLPPCEPHQGDRRLWRPATGMRTEITKLTEEIIILFSTTIK